VVLAIVERCAPVPVQVGGGIRDRATVETYLQQGVGFVIIGTRAVHEPQFVSALCADFVGQVMVGLDAHNGRVATDGWSKLSSHDAIEVAQHFESVGVEAIIYTDIERDGMLSGINIEATQGLAESVKIPVIASGGIRDMQDVRRLGETAGSGILGAITGRAIYEGTLDFSAARQYLAELGNRVV